VRESDYPHSDTNWPFAPEDVIKNMGHLDDVTINRITYENARETYSFDPFAHIPKDACRAGALRAQASDVDVVTHVGHEGSQHDLDVWVRRHPGRLTSASMSSRRAPPRPGGHRRAPAGTAAPRRSVLVGSVGRDGTKLNVYGTYLGPVADEI
jgi:hypothetical protein